jgi:hypothetical protein
MSGISPRLTGSRVGIDQWQETFQAIHDGKGVKAVILFNRD